MITAFSNYFAEYPEKLPGSIDQGTQNEKYYRNAAGLISRHRSVIELATGENIESIWNYPCP